jgi:hypothetical protein
MFELDLMRMTLLVGVVIAALVYQKTRLVTGGLMTGAYVALLISSGSFDDVAGWAVLTLVSFCVIKLFSMLMALPKVWIITIAILTSTIVHTAAVLLSGGKGMNNEVFLSGFEIVIAGGMYITPGLTAYDIARQGWLRTAGVISVVTGSTLVVTFSVSALGQTSGPQLPLTTPDSVFYTSLSFPLVMLVCIAVAEVMRLTFGWGTGGIIGSVFFVELLVASPVSFVVIIVLVAITVALTHASKRVFVLTPRQSFQFTFILGSLIAWVGLSIGSQLGIEAAIIANQYALEPLLAVALISTDVARYGTVGTIKGKVFVLLAVVATNLLVINGSFQAWAIFSVEIALIIVLYIIGFIYVKRGWDHAQAVGEKYPLIPGTQSLPTASDSKRARAKKLRQLKQLERQEKLHVLD